MDKSPEKAPYTYKQAHIRGTCGTFSLKIFGQDTSIFSKDHQCDAYMCFIGNGWVLNGACMNGVQRLLSRTIHK